MNPLPQQLHIDLKSSPVSLTGEEGDPLRSIGGGEGPQALSQLPLTYPTHFVRGPLSSPAKAVEDAERYFQ
jgi:hypothetical protein